MKFSKSQYEKSDEFSPLACVGLGPLVFVNTYDASDKKRHLCLYFKLFQFQKGFSMILRILSALKIQNLFRVLINQIPQNRLRMGGHVP